MVCIVTTCRFCNSFWLEYSLTIYLLDTNQLVCNGRAQFKQVWQYRLFSLPAPGNDLVLALQYSAWYGYLIQICVIVYEVRVCFIVTTLSDFSMAILLCFYEIHSPIFAYVTSLELGKPYDKYFCSSFQLSQVRHMFYMHSVNFMHGRRLLVNRCWSPYHYDWWSDVLSLTASWLDSCHISLSFAFQNVLNSLKVNIYTFTIMWFWRINTFTACLK